MYSQRVSKPSSEQIAIANATASAETSRCRVAAVAVLLMLHPYAGSEEVQYVYVTLPKEVDVATVGPGTVIKLQVISAELQLQ